MTTESGPFSDENRNLAGRHRHSARCDSRLLGDRNGGSISKLNLEHGTAARLHRRDTLG